MATLVTAEVVTVVPDADALDALDRAVGWFAAVERACSRFDEASELRRLVARVGEPIEVSPLLFEAIRFALALAELTDGAFDPAVGRAMVEAGFDRHYATGERTTVNADRAASFRDLAIDEASRTVELRRPLLLDLGAVAKGLAIDLAARELAALGGYCVEAGGDLYAGGMNGDGELWRIGVQHPRDADAMVEVLELTDQAACTSGDYERRTADGAGHHLIDPRTGRAADAMASVTVVAPTAMAADGLATAAFVLGPEAGRRLLEEQGVEGLFVTLAGEVRSTTGLRTAAR